jgi:hypothetical protein
MKNKKFTRTLGILPVALLALAAQPLCAQNALVVNPSFESNYNTTWPSYSSIDSWTGGSGVNESGGPFSNTGTLIPDRDRVAFMQGGGSPMSQTISGLTPGEQYWIQLWYEARNCCSSPSMQLLVQFDGVTVGEVASVENQTTSYQFVNFFFTPTNDTSTLTLKQVVVSGDASVCIDGVNIVQRDAGNVVLMNPSFEASGAPTASTGNPPAADSGEVIAPAAMAGWLWDTNQTGTYGISLVGGVYADNGAIPDQDLVGFISGPGSLSQTVSGLVANTPYQLSFAYNAQSAPGVDAHLQVIVAGKVIDDENVAPVGGSNPYHTKTLTFTPTSAGAVLSFVQTNANGTLLLDDIRLVGQVAPEFTITYSPVQVDLAASQTAEFQVTVPVGFLASSPADLSITMAEPSVAGIVGADTNGALALHFAQGGANVQSFQVVGLTRGSSTINVTATVGLTVGVPPSVKVHTSFVGNPSFEDSAPGAASISSWTGGSGVNTSAGPAMDNGTIPDRAQVAVLQGTTNLSQQIFGLIPGTNYWLQFSYNANYSSSANIDLKVKLGGNVLATITNISPVGFFAGEAVAFYFTNIVFAPTNASELLEFDTTPTVSGTTPALLLDAVNIVQRDANDIVIENPSFEASGEGGSPGYLQPQPIQGWTFTGSYGCNFSPGDPFGDNGMSPDQDEVLFMQGACTVSNVINNLTVGQAYTLSYGVNARTYASGDALTYDVAFGDIPLLLGQAVVPIGAAGSTAPYLVQYLTFTNDNTSGGVGIATHAVGDVTILLDNFHLVPGLRIPPQLVSESPAPGESSISQPELQFVLTQGSYPFNTSNFQLLLNGTNVAASATVTPTNNPAGIIITYAYPKLPPGTNTVVLIVNDQNNPPMTITESFSFVTLAPPPLVVSVGAMMDPTSGTVDVGVGFANTVDDAAGSLLSNYSISSGKITSLTWCTNRFTADSTNPAVTVRKQSALLTVTGLSGNSGTLTVKNVTDTYGSTIGSTNVAFTVATNLTWGNVGANQLGGWQAAVPVGPGNFDIYSDGYAEWGTYDETTFVYEQVTGDFDKKLRVEYQDGSSEWGRAGIVVRDTLNLGVDEATQTGTTPTGAGTAPPYNGTAGRYQKCHVNPVGATLTGPGTAGNASWEGNRRLDTGGASTTCLTNVNAVPDYPNAWCRIQRVGQTFSIFRSADGVTWELLGQTVWGQDDQSKTPMPATVYVGPEFSPENGNITLAADQGTFLAQFRDYGDFTFNPQLTIGLSGGKVTVTWTTGTLVSSPTVNGTYTPVTGATSPYVISPPTGKAMFYQVMQ